jgi:cobyrinic acid a,c-diamide synthase
MQITLRPIIKKQLHERSLLGKRAKQLDPIFPKITKKILIANDAAFNFTYAANISVLSSLGEISYFSPRTDTFLPDADLIYLPGGYPELHLKSLSANIAMRDQLHTFHQNGGKILAECGGMMYLGKYIADDDGTKYPMAGILDIATGMQHKKLSIGYKRINIAGAELKGHKFHYSQYIGEIPISAKEDSHNVSIWNARNERLQLPVFVSKNILASYFHFYFGNNIKAIEIF